MNQKFLRPYNPPETEDRIYKLWENSGYFNPDNLPGERKAIFSMVMPPPNVTGVLHMGHALMITVEDIMARFERMRGKKVLWLPGTDHAAIATQSVVEKDIYKKQGKNRHDIGREEFLKIIEDFATLSHNTIVSQVRKFGASCDWSREAFTLDEKRNFAVRTAFKRMYDAGLIYRGTKVINWDVKGQTTIADDEIVYEEREAVLYTFKYSQDFPIAISTTRPETKLGDTAVAVYPDDPRYKSYIGKTYKLEFAGSHLNIKIVGDKSVDPEFGTGALGVTPAHSQIDSEIAERNKLTSIQVIDELGKIMLDIPELKGKKVLEARESIVEWLKENSLLIEEKTIRQNVSTAERTGGIIEPLPKKQWFINVNKPIKERGGKTLKELMREPLEKGEIKIIPDYFDKTYFHWIDNLRDWCISRQIWYGHRIPVWYKGDNLHVDTEPPKGDGWQQDPDTLDTWFSSQLWTFSTLGWPDKTPDLETYHPTDVLETGYEILFFWVARMILASQFFLGEIPFKTVYLHGTVRDAQGRKMSKSLGNGIDPLDIARDYGADAGRMALIAGTGPGTDSKISVEKIRGYKNFSNKLWNIARYIMSMHETHGEIVSPLMESYVEELDKLKSEITEDLENYRFHLGAEKLYAYIWHRLADVIIEESKNKPEYTRTLMYLLENSLKLLHPFMPFVTEEIWQELHPGEILMIENWPQ